MLYDAYIAKNQDYVSNTTRCGRVCTKTPGKAKGLLLEYLDEVQKKAMDVGIGGNGYFDDANRMQDIIAKDTYIRRNGTGARLGVLNHADFGMPNQLFDFVIWQIKCPESE